MSSAVPAGLSKADLQELLKAKDLSFAKNDAKQVLWDRLRGVEDDDPPKKGTKRKTSPSSSSKSNPAPKRKAGGKKDEWDTILEHVEGRLMDRMSKDKMIELLGDVYDDSTTGSKSELALRLAKNMVFESDSEQSEEED